jgi:hypothetical protein
MDHRLVLVLMLLLPTVLLLGKWTGTHVFLFHFASGIPRFIVGACCMVLAALLLWQCRDSGLRPSCNEGLRGTLFLAAALFAVLLVPSVSSKLWAHASKNT